MKNYLKILNIMVLIVGFGGVACAQVLYQDSFSRTGALAGTQPDVVDTNGNSYVTNSQTGNFITAGGVATNTTDNYGAAYLALNGGSGVSLTGALNFSLSADLTPQALGNGSQTAISLTTGIRADGDLLSNTSLATLVLGNGYAYAYYNGALVSAAFSGITPAATNPASLVYDAAAGTLTYTAGSNTFFTQTGVTAVQIAALQDVAFGVTYYSDPAFPGTIDNFTLSQEAAVPEPSTYALLALSVLLFVGARSLKARA